MSMKDAEGRLTRKAYPYEFWVNKTLFVQAVLNTIPPENREAFAGQWQVTYFLAQLPADELNLLDSRVTEFLSLAGTNVNAIMEKMGLEFPENPENNNEEENDDEEVELD